VKTIYYDEDDTLVIRLSDKPIVREVSQDWHTHISYAADGTVVETVILEAARIGAWPMQIEHRPVA
jgi:predicted ATP-grasp superfamily ATP-dependent carboligase